MKDEEPKIDTETKTKIKTETKIKKDDFGLDPKEMLEAGLYFGHRATRSHPKMEQYILGVKNTVHLIDLEKTVEKLKEALKFIQELISQGGMLLLVGTKIQYKNLVKEIARDCGFPYVTERWLGGTLTNFPVIRKRVDYFLNLEQKQKAGELEKYSKKEKIKINRELGRLKIKYDGLPGLNKLPDAVFIIDMKKDKLAVKEARMKGVKVVALADTNVDPTLADYPIPANDDAISSVKYILEKVKEVILKAKIKTK